MTAVWGGPMCHMTRRRRKLLIVASLVLILGAAAWLGQSGPEMKVELHFLRYTNEPVLMTGLPEGAQVWPTSLCHALVLATNSGGVAVELYASVNMTNYVTNGSSFKLRDGFVGPSGRNMPRILKPGETTVIGFGPSLFTEPWSTELMAQRRGLRDRLYGKVWDTGNPSLQNLISRFPSAFADIRAKLGPVTNLPPAMPLRRPSPSLFDGGRYIDSPAVPREHPPLRP